MVSRRELNVPVRELERNETTYTNIEKRIWEQVRSGELKPSQHLGTTAEIAKKWGVSRSTARFSLQSLSTKGILVRRPGIGTFVSSEINTKNPDEQELSQGQEKYAGSCISLLLPDISISEYGSLAKGIQNAAYDQGIDLVVTSTDDKIEKYDDVIHRHVELNVLGFIMVPPVHSPLSAETIYLMHKNNAFGVSCYRSSGYPNWPVLITDRLAGYKAMVKHLHEIGRKKISFLSVNNPQDDDYFVDKSRFIEGLLDCGLPIYTQLYCGLGMGLDKGLKPISDRIKSMENSLVIWLKEHQNDVDAICCATDYLAAAVVNILKDIGKNVPEDIAVIGHGRIGTIEGCSTDGISTIDSGCYDMGMEACKMLLAMNKGEEFPPNHIVKLNCKLIRDKSTVLLQ
jgi:DNA-binding LacI/PurR family transcriptional regulator